ncbi:hypothetical protein M3Y94_01227100 [Aphelenchoides besseyi]|nr:hypothetical protein M3Y94_01227100 [Aphelenchoides besseyi]
MISKRSQSFYQRWTLCEDVEEPWDNCLLDVEWHKFCALCSLCLAVQAPAVYIVRINRDAKVIVLRIRRQLLVPKLPIYIRQHLQLPNQLASTMETVIVMS